MEHLTEIGIKYQTDKATFHQYTEIYDKYFREYKNPNILEIGVLGGASLEMMNEFFGECSITGFDDCKRRVYQPTSENIRIITGDQTKEEDLEKLADGYDIIIDDGSHKQRDQQISLNFLFKYLKSGGIYIIEDLHTGYNPAYNKEKIITTLDLLDCWGASPYVDLTKLAIKDIQIFKKNDLKDSKKNSITSILWKI
ncbi:MAG TPA: hypothetical protein DCY12_06000 [Candidatus Atribacteria bacterium]|nr:hypothetical protein [Candidatus Atribacteria bacterium]